MYIYSRLYIDSAYIGHRCVEINNMMLEDVAIKVQAKLARLDEARLTKPDWLIGRLRNASRSERSEAIRECYRSFIRQVENGDALTMLGSLNASEGKALLLDLKELLALWTNIKSMESRAKVQVNIQMSREAKSTLKQLASKHRISQGEVIEALLLKKTRRFGQKRTFERAQPISELPSSTPQPSKD